MQIFLAWIDEIAEIDGANKLALWLERAAFIFLVLMILSAPHSIAATQTAWITGMFALVVRYFFVKPRRKLVRTPLDFPLLTFFIWSVVTALTSYAPDISLDKLRGVGLILIFYFVVNAVRNRRAAVFLVFALVFSCMFNVVWTPVERLIGRGVELRGVQAGSVLTKTIYVENNNEKVALKDGDAVLEVNRKKVRSPEELLAALEERETSSLKFYRPDYYLTVQIKRADLQPGENALERLGFADWKKSRNWRSQGFYGHWTTYAEVLQLIASLVFGLFIASLQRRGDAKTRRRGDEKAEDQDWNEQMRGGEPPKKSRFSPRLRVSASPILLFCLAAMMLALLLNVTRASQLAFLVSAVSIVFLAGNRRLILLSAAIILPIALGGLFFLQHSRNVGFFDRQDDSTKYRQTVYREGFDLWTSSARHFAVGVGMDSIKRYAKDWRLFDDGRLPMGHFHSTPLQLVVERGLPALLLWLWILSVYARTLLRGVASFKLQAASSARENPQFAIPNPKFAEWRTRGILLGCFGGLIGFLTSGLVHYNLGDAEVAMVFFMLMGIGVKLVTENKGKIDN